MKSKLWALALLFPMSTISCGSGGSGLEGIFAKMRKDKRAYVASVPFEPPLLFQRGQELVGPEAQLAQRIVDKLKEKPGLEAIELHFITRNYSGMVPAVQNEEASFGMGVFGVTEERQQAIDFSTSYYTMDLGMAIDPPHKDIRAEDLASAALGARSDDAVVNLLKGQYPEAKIQTFDTLDDAVLALKRAEVDTVIDDRHMLAYALDTLPGVSRLEMVPGSLGTIPVAVGVKKGQTELMEIINGVIGEVQAQNQYAQWLTEFSADRLAKIESRHTDRLESERRAQATRQVVIRISKDPGNSFDIYRMANLSFVMTNRESGKSYGTSRINFQGRTGVSSVSVPPGNYSLTLPRFNFSAGTVLITPTDPNSVSINIRLQPDNSVVVTKG